MDTTFPLRTPHGVKRRRLSHEDYTIAFIVPLGVELTPVRALLDAIHDDLPLNHYRNAYVLGEIGYHNIVVVALPSIGYNEVGAAANQLKNDFPCIRFGLLVGIGGGVPGIGGKNDIRLGDVVVSESFSTSGAVIQLDRGRRHAEGRFEPTGHLNKPPPFLAATVKKLKAQHQQEGNKIRRLIADMIGRNPIMKRDYTSPNLDTDQLFKTGYKHQGGDDCQRCDRDMSVERPKRDYDQHRIHYGCVGSSNAVLRDAAERDRLSREYNILCVEMEAAGLMDTLPCLVIKGICDYADSHKNKQWQPYAAASAAAYAKELIQSMSQERPLLSHQGVALSRIDTASSPPTAEHNRSSRKSSDVTSTNLKFDKLSESLTFDRMDARLRNIKDALPRTCKWLFEDEKFQTWKNRDRLTETHGFLWIKGKPGSGKSTIMKTALAWTKKKQSSENLISYFFNARAPGDLEKSSMGLYRSLTYQLLHLSKLPHVRTHFVEEFSSKEREGVVEDWTEVELQAFLNHVVASIQNQPLNIFIDALDEGEESDVRRMVAFLEELGSIAHLSDTFLRICLSSRHYPHISVKRSLSLVMEDQPGHKSDISTYIQNKLVGDESAELEIIRQKVYEKAQGVFLWVALVVPIVNRAYARGRPGAMLQCLDDIPEDLDGLFENILTKSAESFGECRLILRWVLFSARPLNRTELFLAMQSQDFGSCDKDADIPSEATLDRYILDNSRGLVELTKDGQAIVQFIHETVRGYLKRDGAHYVCVSGVAHLEGDCHESLKTICFHYIERRSSVVGNNETKDKAAHEINVKAVKSDFPFLQYAVDNMFTHANLAESNGITQNEFLEQFNNNDNLMLLSWVRARNTFQAAKVRRYTLKVPLLYILAEYGFSDLVKVLIKISPCDLTTKERFGSVLQAACAAGHEQIVRALLQGGANVNYSGGECRHALLAATYYKKGSLLPILLQAGAKPDLESLQYGLFKAIERQYLPGVQVLVSLGPSVLQSTRRETPFLFALSKGHVAIAEWLLCEYSSIGLQFGKYGNALQAAAYYGQTEIVRQCLRTGLDVNAQGGYYGNALQAAAWNGSIQVVQLLIDNGANMNIQGSEYGNALQAAALGDKIQVVQLLIDKGADVNAQGGEYGNALQAAVLGDKIQVVQLLIDKGADVNAQGGYHGNALQAAAWNGKIQVVQLLIDKGADVNAQGGYYGNALQAALQGGHRPIVQLLKSLGAVHS